MLGNDTGAMSLWVAVLITTTLNIHSLGARRDASVALSERILELDSSMITLAGEPIESSRDEVIAAMAEVDKAVGRLEAIGRCNRIGPARENPQGHRVEPSAGAHAGPAGQ